MLTQLSPPPFLFALRSVRTSLSADDEMASKKRKGGTASERARRVSHSSAQFCSLHSACLIKPNNRGKSKRPTAFGSFQSGRRTRTDGRSRFCNGCRPADALCSLLWGSFTYDVRTVGGTPKKQTNGTKSDEFRANQEGRWGIQSVKFMDAICECPPCPIQRTFCYLFV